MVEPNLCVKPKSTAIMDDILEVKYSSDFGRYLVAKKSFRPGDKVIVEEPLITAPSSIDDPTTSKHFVCIGCYKIILKEKALRCGKCDWYACSKKCVDARIHWGSFGAKAPPKFLKKGKFFIEITKIFRASHELPLFGTYFSLSPTMMIFLDTCLLLDHVHKDLDTLILKVKWHKNFECNLFADQEIVPTFHSLKYIYLVRALICAESDPSMYKKILELSSSIQVMQKSFKSFVDKHCEEGFKFVTTQCSMYPEQLMVEKLVKTFVVNCFGIDECDKAGNLYCGEALYATSCLLSHSCSPNVDWVIPPSSEMPGERWHLTLRARHAISPGDILSISYIQSDMTCGTIERRLQIVDDFHFECKCPRCSDPSELGTKFSGFECQNCTAGVLLPEKPLEFNTNWKCDKCDSTLTFGTTEKLEESFDLTLVNILRNKNDDDCCSELDALIKDCGVKYGLYRNHNLVIRATIHWLSRVDLNILVGSGSHVDEMYKLLKKRTTECLEVCSKIGALTYWITCEGTKAMLIIKYRFKSLSGLSLDCDYYTSGEKMMFIKRIVKHFQRGIRLIKGNGYCCEYEKIEKKMADGFEFWRNQYNKFAQNSN